MKLRIAILFAFVMALGVLPSIAWATGPSQDAAAAEVLFRAGLAARNKGDWNTALSKFKASMDLDPAVGTLINIAKCHEHEGKLAAAYSDLKRALVLNRGTPGAQRKKELERTARGLLIDLEPRISKLTIVVRERPNGLKITRDEMDVVAALGDALPVDPGVHEIQASAPGFVEEKHTVTLVEGESATVELSLVRKTVSKRQVATYVAGGVGVAGLVLGGVMGAVVISKKGEYDANCGESGGFVHSLDCTKAGLAVVEAAKTPSLLSTIGFGAGIAGGVTAAVLMATERKRTSGASEKVHVGILSAGHEGATFGIWGAW